MKKVTLVLGLVLALVSSAYAQRTPPHKPSTKVENTVCSWADTVKAHVSEFGYEETIIYYSKVASFVHGYEVVFTEEDITNMEAGLFLPFPEVQQGIIIFMQYARIED